jgi:hypothetical protein
MKGKLDDFLLEISKGISHHNLCELIKIIFEKRNLVDCFLQTDPLQSDIVFINEPDYFEELRVDFITKMLATQKYKDILNGPDGHFLEQTNFSEFDPLKKNKTVQWSISHQYPKAQYGQTLPGKYVLWAFHHIKSDGTTRHDHVLIMIAGIKNYTTIYDDNLFVLLEFV